MTPQECKTAILAEYDRLLDKAAEGRINSSAIPNIIMARCREAARHNGVPEYWREYMPERLKREGH